jgi:hypothetical protein
MKNPVIWPTLRGLCIVALVSGVVLAFCVNLSLPTDQDQGGKAGRIACLVYTGKFFDTTFEPHYYRDLILPLYYMISSLFCSCMPLNVYGAMNVLSMLFGIACFVSLAYTLKRTHEVAYWETLVVFLSMPVLLSSYSYGNEKAMGFTFTVVAMAVAVADWRWKIPLSAASFAAAVYCRPDFLLLGFFWLAWVGLYGGADRSARAIMRRVFHAGSWCTVLGGLFWLVFMRYLPPAQMSFEYETHLKILLAYLVYPFCPTVVLLAGAAMAFLLWRKYPDAFIIVFLCLIPVAYYIRILSSPKHIIGTALFYGIPAALLLHHLKSYWKAAATAAILAWWMVSVSPFGIKGPLEGRYWTLPTSHGQLPIGSYLTFFDLARQGFFQEQYLDEISSQEDTARFILDHKNDRYLLFGHFNDYFIRCFLAERGLFDDYCKSVVLKSIDPPPASDKRILMVRYTLMRLTLTSPELYEWINQALLEGRVRDCLASSGVFPGFVEIGPSVPPGTDTDLGQRILFLQKYYADNGAFQTSRPADCYKPLWWVRRSEDPRPNGGLQYGRPVYEDPQFLCFSRPVPNAEIWRTRVPFVYYSEGNPHEPGRKPSVSGSD